MNRKSLFIISDGYSARTLIFQLNYVLDIDIKRIYLLKENHSLLETFYDLEIQLIDSKDIKKYVVISDYIFVIGNEKLLQQISKIIKPNNRLIVFPKIKNDELYIQKPDIDINFKDIPVILNISIGDYSSIYRTEILLNKILSKNEVNFYQEFSKSSLSIIETFAANKLLNNKIQESIKPKCKKNINVILTSLMFKDVNDFIENECLFDIIKYIEPNYIVISASIDYMKKKDLFYNIFLYKYKSILNMIIQSPYILSQNKKFPVFCNNFLSNQDKRIYSLEDKNTENILESDLFANIAYPSNMSII